MYLLALLQHPRALAWVIGLVAAVVLLGDLAAAIYVAGSIYLVVRP